RPDANPPLVTSAKPRVTESSKSETASVIRPQETVVSKTEGVKAPARPAEVKKVEAPPAAPKSEVKREETKSPEQVAVIQKAPESREPSLPVEKKKAEPASTQVKTEVKIPEAKATPVVPAQSQQDKVAEKSTGDRVALLKDKPGESVPDKKDLVKPVPKALEGYIIQLAFSERKS